MDHFNDYKTRVKKLNLVVVLHIMVAD